MGLVGTVSFERIDYKSFFVDGFNLYEIIGVTNKYDE